MATAVIMPRQGQSVESCIITEWNKKVGEAVKEGDVLFSYETDKAAFEETAKQDGTLLAVFYGVDDDVPCLNTVAVIGAPGESTAEYAPEGATAFKPEGAAEPAVNTAAVPAAPVAYAATATAISPRARQTAERLCVDPATAAPTGPNGRVIERDVFALAKSGARATPGALAGLMEHKGDVSGAGTGIGGRVTYADLLTPGAALVKAPAAAQTIAAAPVPEAEYVDVKLSNLRRVIAKSMQESLATMAQLTHTSSFDATAILNFRKQLKAAPEGMGVPNISLNDIVLFACSRVLKQHPDLNAHYLDDKIRRFTHVHLGFAVDTPRGLLVPTIFNADEKSLNEIAAEVKSLAAAAQSGSINPDFLTGASFTVSNLGALGVEHFTPVINPPQTGILGVSCMIDRVRAVDAEITAYPAMGLSLTYDHRALDGAPASRFLRDLGLALENFNTLLIG